ncbi:Diacylglycerol kinase epsilon [Portunus trituberculatus]|uniref:Diacylglycerol kinase epsilon n=1 Tax=Portunus trituberculatus TaxID=210409 RepID=A0A5B7F5A3_PORTR|nr:Diacylglycerol kinase epsilon [Portunus trituberculatus]
MRPSCSRMKITRMSDGSGQVFLCVVFSLLLVLLLVRLSRRPPRYSLRARDVLKGHSWCSTHSSIKVCDFGKLRQYIVPPNCIRLKYSRMKQHLYIKEVLKPNISGWSPVIVMGNTKSGSSEADAVLSSFCSVLNPAQVIDLNRCPPEEALEWCHLLPPDVTCRVVVAGDWFLRKLVYRSQEQQEQKLLT